MSTIVHELDDSEWNLVTVKLQADGDKRTVMYASHRGCGWVPPINSLKEKRACCSTCGAQLSEKLDRTIRVHNFVMKIGD